MNLLGDSHVGTPGGLWGGGVQACRETLEAQKLLLLKKGGGGQQTRLLQVFQSEGDSGRWVGGVERGGRGEEAGDWLEPQARRKLPHDRSKSRTLDGLCSKSLIHRWCGWPWGTPDPTWILS